MIDIGVARPSAHGHAMISTATALTSACASRGSGPTSAQTTNVDDRDRDRPPARTSRDTGRPAAGSARATALRLADHARRSARAACRARRARPASRTLPVPLTVPPVTRLAGALLDRHRLAGDHRLVDGARALEHDAVDRHPLARPHAQPVADAGRARAARPLRAPSASTRRAVFGARPSRLRIAALGPAARAQLEHLAEQHERDDHRRRLEVDGRPSPCAAERRREQPGRERRDHAVDVRRARRRARSA